MADPLVLSSYLSNPLALTGLALIVPIILLYLLRPKPKLVPFPSTMFIRFIEKNKRFTSFLQRFIHDPLLLLQLLIITLIVAALANPYYMSKQDLRTDESIVFVLDASASMQARDESPTRFDAALSKAKELVRGLNKNDEVSIVLAENIPAIIISKGTPESAYGALGLLNVSDTPTNIGDAMMLGRDILASSTRKRVIYVLSDFASSGGLDPAIATKVAKVSGVDVQLLRFGSSGKNIGIVTLDAKRSSAADGELYMTASVRNFESESAHVTMNLFSGERTLDSQSKDVEAGGEGFFFFRPNISLGESLIRASLDSDDDLPSDNAAWAFVPAVRLDNVLVLTSTGQDNYLRLMLESLRNVKQPATFDTSISPLSVKNDYDIIVLGNIRKDITPDTFRDISAQVQKGTSLVVVGSDNLAGINDGGVLWQMMPVTKAEVSAREATLRVNEEHEMLQDVVFDSVTAKKYLNTAERDNLTKTIVSTEFQSPIISIRPFGEGTVVYVGINSEPDWSNLYYSSSFPIFWSQMIKYLTKEKGQAQATTMRTGEYLELPQSLNVRMPSGQDVYASSLFLDRAGIYNISYPDRTEPITVNLLDAKESNITGMADLGDSGTDYAVQKQEVDMKVDVYRQILVAMLIGLSVELILYRRRGML